MKEQKLNESKSKQGKDKSKHKAKNEKAKAKRHGNAAKPGPTKASLAHAKPSCERHEGDQTLRGA